MEDDELQDCGIEELYGSRGRPPLSVPQIVPEEEQYSWQFLEQLPYGMSMWDIASVEGKQTVVFMAREPRADVEPLPKTPKALWRAMSLGVEIDGHKVMPVIVMIYFVPLQTIYEIWFNFYGEAQESVQEAFTLLGQQPNLYLFFHDRGSEPVRKFGFRNDIAYFFKGHYGVLKAVPEWSDADFNEAKRRLMDRYTGEQLWRLE
jgi:hypothetical protein